MSSVSNISNLGRSLLAVAMALVIVSQFPITSYASSEPKISDEGVKFIANFEGLSTTLYNDDAGHCTIGYGHIVHRGKCNRDSSEDEFRPGITKERALELFRNDLAIAERAVNTLVTVPLNQAQFDALVSFTYNLGVGIFEKSDLLKELNAGYYGSVPQELDRWVYGGGIRLPGLERRRHDEGVLFQFGNYASKGVDDGRTIIILSLISPGVSSEPGPYIDTLSPTFQWQGLPNADYYALYISKYPYGPDSIVFNSEVHYGSIYDDSFTLSPGYLQEGIKYRWNMSAHSDSGWSESSDKLYFQVQGTRISTTERGQSQPDSSTAMKQDSEQEPAGWVLSDGWVLPDSSTAMKQDSEQELAVWVLPDGWVLPDNSTAMKQDSEQELARRVQPDNSSSCDSCHEESIQEGQYNSDLVLAGADLTHLEQLKVEERDTQQLPGITFSPYTTTESNEVGSSECNLWISDKSNSQRHLSFSMPLSTWSPIIALACDSGPLTLYEKYPDGSVQTSYIGYVTKGQICTQWFFASTSGPHVLWFSVNGRTSNSITFNVLHHRPAL